MCKDTNLSSKHQRKQQRRHKTRQCHRQACHSTLQGTNLHRPRRADAVRGRTEDKAYCHRVGNSAYIKQFRSTDTSEHSGTEDHHRGHSHNASPWLRYCNGDRYGDRLRSYGGYNRRVGAKHKGDAYNAKHPDNDTHNSRHKHCCNTSPQLLRLLIEQVAQRNYRHPEGEVE